ncbi:MAG TPA: tRNA-intron lyase [Candidatus Thermoplasmatota archaeon]|nr:tRNA-intron lyase [Candidatus Thermoplasmatota archaeon]
MPPAGTLQKDRVLVADEKEANALYNKGFFGVPQSGGSLQLDLIEALYLLENRRLSVRDHDVASLLRHASAAEHDFEIRYIVYRDLRDRTFVVKPSNLTDPVHQRHDVTPVTTGVYNVYARGAVPGRSPSTHLVRCASERGALDGPALLAEIDRAKKHQKLLLVALVDEEGDLTYFDAREPSLSADAPTLPHHASDAHLLDDRVVVSDPDQGKALFADGYFGRDVGIGHQLSFPEAVYLAEAGKLTVLSADGRTIVGEALLRERASALEPDFPLRLALYGDLRRRGLVVKTGFKFGTHFRIYTGAPDEEHAPYLVHALPAERRVAWPEVAGFVRLAHGVRKRLFFAVPTGPGFRLLELARRKP